MTRLAGKIAVVTGATSGIGAAIATRFAAEGAHVVLGGRNKDRGKDVIAAIAQAGGKAVFFPTDIRLRQDCEALIAEAETRFGGLDILVNSAGVIHRANAEDTTDEQWRETMTVNLDGTFFASRAAISPLKRRGGGVIINVASDWALVGGVRAVAYCASKGAVAQLTRAMALDHARDGIRINALCPGETDTPMLDNEFHQLDLTREEGLATYAADIPVGRVASAEEIAHAALFLASPDSAYMIGSMMVVDGGNSAG